MNQLDTMTAVQVGDDVYGSDGEKVGTVAEVQPTYLVVEKGFFFPTDYYIPLSAITQVTDGQVWLTVSKESALHSGWERVPEDTASMATGERIMAGEHGWDLASEVTATDRVLDQAAAGQSVQAGSEATSEEDLVIPLREEELTASVRETEAGAARIHKRVVAEDRVLEVPVTEEQIRVERRVVDRPAETGAADAFEEIVIEVPLTQEEVELRTQARVAEEVVVHKEAVQHTEQVRGTVRREELDVVDEGLLANPIDDSESRA